MAVRNDWEDGQILYADDLNDNFNYTFQALGNSINQNSLEILELQAESSLESGQSAYMVRDLFTDTNGYLDTVDTVNTTSLNMSTPKRYYNLTAGSEEIHTQELATKSSNSAHTITATAITKGYISYVACYRDTTTNFATFTVSITQNSTVIASKTSAKASGYSSAVTFTPIDYSSYLEPGVFTISITMGGTGKIAYDYTDRSFTGTYWSFATQRPMGWPGASYSSNMRFTPLLEDDTLIQSEKIDLDITPTKCQLFAFSPETEGTSSITADLSFNNGTNYQSITFDTPTDITNQGSEMILKLNLNKGVSDELVSIKGYGVMFW